MRFSLWDSQAAAALSDNHFALTRRAQLTIDRVKLYQVCRSRPVEGVSRHDYDEIALLEKQPAFLLASLFSTGERWLFKLFGFFAGRMEDLTRENVDRVYAEAEGKLTRRTVVMRRSYNGRFWAKARNHPSASTR